LIIVVLYITLMDKLRECKYDLLFVIYMTTAVVFFYTAFVNMFIVPHQIAASCDITNISIQESTYNTYSTKWDVIGTFVVTNRASHASETHILQSFTDNKYAVQYIKLTEINSRNVSCFCREPLFAPSVTLQRMDDTVRETGIVTGFIALVVLVIAMLFLSLDMVNSPQHHGSSPTCAS